MSAFLCSDEHISALVNAARMSDAPSLIQRYAPAVLASALVVSVATDPTSEDAVFNLLLEENIKSLEHRYPDDSNWPEAQAYRYRGNVEPASVVEAIKLASSYAYQSCEHEGWETSQAKRYIDELTSNLIVRLPGYENARWAL